jgi:hypothetical protein
MLGILTVVPFACSYLMLSLDVSHLRTLVARGANFVMSILVHKLIDEALKLFQLKNSRLSVDANDRSLAVETTFNFLAEEKKFVLT